MESSAHTEPQRDRPYGSLRTRILLGMMGGILSFVALTFVVMDGLVARVLSGEVVAALERAERTHGALERTRDDLLLDKARALAQAPHLRAVLGTPDVDRETVAVTARELLSASGAALVLLLDAEGDLVADPARAMPGESSMHSRPGVAESLAGHDSVGIWEHGATVWRVAASAVSQGGGALGLVAVGQPLDTGTADELRSVTGQDVLLLHAGRVLAGSFSDGRTLPEGASDSRAAAAAWEAAVGGEPVRIALGGSEYMAVAIPLGPDTTLVLSRPIAAALTYFTAAKRMLLLCALALGCLALLFGLRIARRVSRPIEALRAGADALARGERFERVSVESNDEVAALARSFNAMADQIEGLIDDVTRKAQDAEQANEAKSAFLATVSHELRTPLNGVLGFAEHLLSTPLEVDQRAQLQLIQRAGEDLLGIIEDVLDYSKIEAGEVRLEDTPFSLPRALKRALEPLELEARRKGLALKVEIADDVPQSLCGAASRLRQVLLNFVGNAVKFTQRGEVEVKVSLVAQSATHATVQFVVRDTGIGIPADRMDRLFKPFSQVEDAHDRRFGGTGLGLAISKDLVEMMGGICGAESKPGVGSHFWFTARFEIQAVPVPQAEEDAASIRELLAARTPTEILPALPAAVLRRFDKNRNGVSGAEGAPRVLLVEDNPINQKMAELVLRKGGYEYDVALDGIQALEHHARHDYGLILMDCQMPVMDGLEATRRIRRAEEGTELHVPILALTANAFEQDRDECLQAGMDDFLSKPFKAEQLLGAIERWLRAGTRRAP